MNERKPIEIGSSVISDWSFALEILRKGNFLRATSDALKSTLFVIEMYHMTVDGCFCNWLGEGHTREDIKLVNSK